ncbi:hypothetical protein NEILACOT_04189 [Neisseria lactamica ATCC 23970]|uniref:Uncharacterized protein n=1 Tax=Neisseria lactamica ATCC 23970 TaxID=546265 RepID=D0W9H7_NEILA|nr:hypothetical protein NEILACOT_04189 [Neisseria lactamica ATCC 23970]
MTVGGVWWCGAYDGALRGFRLEYIIFFAGGGFLHYWMILREGGVWGFGLVWADWWRRQYSKIIWKFRGFGFPRSRE